MFTLIYFQGKFNRPDTLVPFLGEPCRDESYYSNRLCNPIPGY